MDRISTSTSLEKLDATEKAMASSVSLVDNGTLSAEVKLDAASRPSNIKKVYALAVTIVLVGALVVVLLGLCGVFEEDKDHAEGRGTASFMLNSTYPPML